MNSNPTKQELIDLNAALLLKSVENPFFITDDYFEHFSESLSVGLNLNSSDHNILPGISGEVYDVPGKDQYFTELPEAIIHKIKKFEAIVIQNQLPWADDHKITPFEVPEGYFEGFPFAIHNNAVKELEALSPVLAQIKQESENIFKVPDSYFQETKIADRVEQQPPNVLKHPSTKSIKWARWAAAATILLIFSIGGWRFFSHQNTHDGIHQEQLLAQISNEQIIDYLMVNLNEYEISELNLELSSLKELKVRRILNSYNDKDIQYYLDTEVW